MKLLILTLGLFLASAGSARAASGCDPIRIQPYSYDTSAIYFPARPHGGAPWIQPDLAR